MPTPSFDDRLSGQAPAWGLPDPDFDAAFYRDVPVKRAIAWVIDSVLISLLVALAILLTAGIGILFAGFLFLAIGFAYRAVTLAMASATPGMRLMAIELRDHHGQRLDGLTAVLHTLIYSFSVSFVLPQLASIALMLTTPRKQGLGDMLLGTAAINRPAAARP